MNKCSGCGREINWPYRNCPACSQDFFANLGRSPQPVQSDGEIVQKVDKEPPKRTPKTRISRGFRLSCNVCEADRRTVLAQRCWRYLQDNGGTLWLSRLYYLMSAWRYGSDWWAAWGLLITTGVATVQGSGKHRQLHLI